jgi:hypothetical protein
LHHEDGLFSCLFGRLLDRLEHGQGMRFVR